MNTEQAAKLIEGLEAVRDRPKMYFGSIDFKGVKAAAFWLHGYTVAIRLAFSLVADFTLEEEVWKSHGWERIGMHPYEQMARRGVPPEAAIDELLMMEIEWLKLLARGRT
jgi:hypothetical protein